jgi:hypothetical protein
VISEPGGPDHPLPDQIGLRVGGEDPVRGRGDVAAEHELRVADNSVSRGIGIGPFARGLGQQRVEAGVVRLHRHAEVLEPGVEIGQPVGLEPEDAPGAGRADA